MIPLSRFLPSKILYKFCCCCVPKRVLFFRIHFTVYFELSILLIHTLISQYLSNVAVETFHFYDLQEMAFISFVNRSILWNSIEYTVHTLFYPLSKRRTTSPTSSVTIPTLSPWFTFLSSIFFVLLSILRT